MSQAPLVLAVRTRLDGQPGWLNKSRDVKACVTPAFISLPTDWQPYDARMEPERLMPATSPVSNGCAPSGVRYASSRVMSRPLCEQMSPNRRLLLSKAFEGCSTRPCRGVQGRTFSVASAITAMCACLSVSSVASTARNPLAPLLSGERLRVFLSRPWEFNEKPPKRPPAAPVPLLSSRLPPLFLVSSLSATRTRLSSSHALDGHNAYEGDLTSSGKHGGHAIYLLLLGFRFTTAAGVEKQPRCSEG